MARVIFDRARQRVPIVCWAEGPSEHTVRQLQRVANLPFVVDRVCAMADAHVSDGIAVGTVFATEGVLVPRALGSDLGCGMAVVRLGIAADDVPRPLLQRILRDLDRAVPAGDALHRGAGIAVPDSLFEGPLSTHALERARGALAPRHLGTLGGGNHFVEIDRDAEGDLWLLVHSGSRGLGAAVAGHHVKASDGGDATFAGLRTDERAGAAYLSDLEWAVAFARANRRSIAERACGVIGEATGLPVSSVVLCDVPHNHARREAWDERQLLVHRKGAIGLCDGELGLVPGSMGTASYLVRGRGTARAFGSCSHGAGRVLSRGEAARTITPQNLRRAMGDIVFPDHLAKRLVEEAPTAYRDIRAVLEAQEDLVTRALRLEPLAVLKGA